ncbi:MAG TPA: hypothetical protein VJM46_01545 [Candidatus Saccharimonadales bacterium]|nr:hypothetical protein [Candidatus Saccharimonadales bacterium]
MPPDANLPKRRAGGYTVTDIVLEVTAGAKLVERITSQVTLPVPPNTPVNEVQLSALIRTLVRPAGQALAILQRDEGAKARNGYAQAQYERVQVRVLSGGRLIGRVNGAGQTFDPRGAMTSPGARVIVDTTPVNRRRRGGTDGNNRKS